MTYRRRINSDVWHWIPECSWWPRLRDEDPVGDNRIGLVKLFCSDQIRELNYKPNSGELCNECIAKAKARSR